MSCREYNQRIFLFQNKEKELNLAQINQRELDSDAASNTIVELQDKIQRLQEDVKLKEVELSALRTANSNKVRMAKELYVLFSCVFPQFFIYSGKGVPNIYRFQLMKVPEDS